MGEVQEVVAAQAKPRCSGQELCIVLKGKSDRGEKHQQHLAETSANKETSMKMRCNLLTAYLKRGYRQARYELEKKPDSEVSSVPGAVAFEEGYGDEIAAPLDEAMELQYPEDV